MKPTVTKSTDKAIEKNLIQWIEAANEDQVKKGISWYKEAMQFSKELSIKFNIESYTVATVVSCLSPNNKWEQNKKDAQSSPRHCVLSDEVITLYEPTIAVNRP